MSDPALILTVPLGLDPSLYPWGVQSISEYINHSGVAEAFVWALHEEAWPEGLLARHGSALAEFVSRLTGSAKSVFCGHAVNPYLVLGVIGEMGAEALVVAERNGLFRWPLRPRTRSTLRARFDELAAEYREHLDAGVRACMDATGASSTRVWGLSVYDYTFFNASSLVRSIRRVDPSAQIVLGGDYFDYRSALACVRTVHDVDAVVVGYGEEVMRQALEVVAGGGRISDAEIRSLVTRNAADESQRVEQMQAGEQLLSLGKASLTKRATAVVVPPSYDGGDEVPVDYVQVEDDGTVRVLTQRGCSWGRCTFCSQIDRRLFFKMNLDAILVRLAEVLASTPADGIRRISLDADENDVNAILPILDVLARSPGRYELEFWLMVRKFGVELPRALRRLTNVDVTIILNIESMSESTLKAMKKGVVPLQIIEAVKAVQDAGHRVRTNYFLNFPGETLDSVSTEVALLQRIPHLFHPDKLSFSSFSYMQNTRDEISHRKQDFGVGSGRIPEDVWLREGFGLELPFSIWTVSNERTRPSARLDELVPYSFHRMVFEERAQYVSAAMAGLFPSPQKPVHRLRSAVARGRHGFWLLLHRGLQRLAANVAFDDRYAFFREAGRDRSVELKVDSGSLTARGRPEKLSHLESELLEFLYWRRKRADILARFASSLADVETALERHLALGTVVTDGRAYLCVAHQPGYFTSDTHAQTGPAARVDFPVRRYEPVKLASGAP